MHSAAQRSGTAVGEPQPAAFLGFCFFLLFFFLLFCFKVFSFRSVIRRSSPSVHHAGADANPMASLDARACRYALLEAKRSRCSSATRRTTPTDESDARRIQPADRQLQRLRAAAHVASTHRMAGGDWEQSATSLFLIPTEGSATRKGGPHGPLQRQPAPPLCAQSGARCCMHRHMAHRHCCNSLSSGSHRHHHPHSPLTFSSL